MCVCVCVCVCVTTRLKIFLVTMKLLILILEELVTNSPSIPRGYARFSVADKSEAIISQQLRTSVSSSPSNEIYKLQIFGLISRRT